MKNILVTGCAGFIGFHLCESLLKKKYKKYNIHGIDNLNDYYSSTLKKKRLNFLKKEKKFFFTKIDISDNKKISRFFKLNKFDIIFHLAAEPGVRNSIFFPNKYIRPNIIGFFNIIDLAREHNIKKVVYASSSSVYGNSETLPTFENYRKAPESFYAFSKYANEQMAELYSKIYNINFIGLRFFTIFGEWGRPDMLIGKVIAACLENKNFDLNFYGKHKRDFTYVADAIKMIDRLYKKKLKQKHSVFNICSNRAVSLKKIVNIFRKHFKKIKFKKRKYQKGDVYITHGSNNKLKRIIGDINITPIDQSLTKTINWYKSNLSFINK
jgi:UDP-glucuronate 4-epimerase